MTDLERIKKVLNELYDIEDIAYANFGEEGYKAIKKAEEAVGDAWRACKKGREAHLGTMQDPVNNSRKPIKSSLENRLVPYLEEFEEGYADALTSTDEMGNNARLETFYEIFKNDYNLSDDDINKLEGAVQDIWHETEEENTEHDMGEMYGAPHDATPEEALKHFE